MKRQQLFVILAAGIALAASSGCAAPAEQVATESSAEATTPTVVTDAAWSYDIDNDNMVAAMADTIVVGTVASQVEPSGSRQAPDPETQFQVEVNSTLKGDAEGVITVSQLGGYVPEANTVLMMGSDPLMTVGASYVMALVFDPTVGWYTASPTSNGIEQIPTDQAEGLDPSGTQRRGGPAEPAAVADMRDAIANPQFPAPPIPEEGEGE